MNLVKYGVFIAQLSLLPLLIAISPAAAESIEAETTKTNFIRDIDSRHEVSISAKDLLAQSNLTSVTVVKLNRSGKGLEVVLTTRGKKLVPLIFPEGNNLVIDILDATLAPAIKNGFIKTNPAPGIKQVRLTKVDESSIRLTIAGETQTPNAEIIPSVANSVVLNIVPTRTAQTEIDEVDKEIEIIATDEAENNYYVPDASTATRTDTPLRDIPQSVQIIPQQVIEDRQATSLEEVATNSSGVTFSGDNFGRGANFAIRGFNNTAILRDGFRVYNRAAQGVPETANLERVEIVKGPASVVFGESEPGGLINLVSKQPLSEPFYDLQLQLGNDNLVRFPVDLSGPLTEDANLNYRLNALYQYEESFRDFDSGFERFFVAPTLAWQITDNTDLAFSLEYTHDTAPVDLGTIVIDGEPADIARERVFNNPSDKGEREFINTGYTFEHRFNEDWKIRNAFRYISNNYGSQEDNDTQTVPIIVDESTNVLTRTFTQEEREEDSFTLYTNVEGSFATGKVEHNLLLGIDFNHSQTDLSTRFDPFPLDSSNPNLTFINIFEPDYDAFPAPAAENIDFFVNDDVTNDRLGIYLQDKIDLLDNLILLAGLRYDTFDQTITNNLDNSEVSQDSDAFSPRIGIVYQPIEAISLYTNYSQSFNPKPFLYNRSFDGTLLEPETGEGFEVGLKGEIVPNRLAATVAYFKIAKENVATEDGFNPFAAVVIEEQQSQGIELDLAGEIQSGWNIIASYAYIDSEITEDNNPDLIGNRFPNIPEHSASLWTTYEIQQGDLEGLGLGIGFNYVGERQGGLPNSFEVDSYFLTNAALFYNRQNWQLRLNFNNLFDVDFIESVDTSSVRRIDPGRPFVVRGSVSVQL